MKHKATTLITLGLVASLSGLGLSACGTSAENTQNATDGATNAVEQLPARGDAPDPHTLQGPSSAQPVGDIEPVTEAAQPQLPVSFSDATGTPVEVTDVSRILALDMYGTLSRTVSGLGLGENIVGRTVSSEEPALADLPVVTESGHSLNAEAILQLRPSVVLVDESVGPPEVIQQIRDAGVPVAVLDPRRNRDSLEDDITLVAGALGVREEGKALAERTRAQMEQASTEVSDLAPYGDDRLRMAYLYMRGNGGVFFILGQGSGADGMIEALGGRDVASEAGIVDVKPANAESLAELNPEVIVVMEKGLESVGGVEGLLARPGVAQTEAGKNRRIVSLPDSEAISMGPQAGLSLVRAAQAVYLGEDAGANQ
ncbi:MULTISPECIES: heme/hemin ABC transporter substrate-binding protein [unclassified Corynebacterium]|uniref:heme/hemin ABC transporter substrate-binding protein n=1 Tax=unclassified Corynebacterium TaxID=2624378 RepID=UPI0029C9B884|nr:MULTISPECIES: ABC transporter substrate-binding protein [unclassified Corynebacterium]WPF65804.1 ABC transporter substrate-binding protein [Corynebacterium sp. 22KM0430]WPF68297.1 ABC transporter substrate-binding protein [Corynebacterium sp. 21KM1197]